MAKKSEAQNNVQPAPAEAPAPAPAPAPAEAPAPAPAEANELSEDEKKEIIISTTKNQLEETAKRVQKEVNSLNGALKALCNEKIYQELFLALGLKSYDEIRSAVMQSIAYASNDSNGKFVAVTLKPIARFGSETYYKVIKLNWFKAVAQSTYRLARGLKRVQGLSLDSYYKRDRVFDNLFDEVTEATICTEIERQIKVDKYNKLVSRLDKAKLEI